MPLRDTKQITGFGDADLAILQDIINEMRAKIPGFRYVTSAPSDMDEHEIVIMDDGAGDKRLYVKTGKGNLGYVTLT